jgi:pyruvate dehydrogenase E2 component (dihydrolipoamide acetyltransferase)
MEFESFHEGVLLHIGINEGVSAKVDTLLAIIGEKGENITEIIAKNAIIEIKEENTPKKTDQVIKCCM